MRKFKNNDKKKLIINDECQKIFSSQYISLNFVLFTILKFYVYNYLVYARMKPTFNYYYNNLRGEVHSEQTINQLSQIPREKSELSHGMEANDGDA